MYLVRGSPPCCAQQSESSWSPETNLSVKVKVMIWVQKLRHQLLLLRFSSDQQLLDRNRKFSNLMKLCRLTAGAASVLSAGCTDASLSLSLSAAHTPQRSGHLHPHADPRRTRRLRRQAEDRRSDPGGERDQPDRGRLPEVLATGGVNEGPVVPTLACLCSWLLWWIRESIKWRSFILSVSAELSVTGLFFLFLFLCACSAVDLIRLGGGRLRFLVAKSDLDVSEKISASSCWLPSWSDKGEGGGGGGGHGAPTDGVRANTHNVCECCEIQLQHKDKVGRKYRLTDLVVLVLTGGVRGTGRKRKRRSGLTGQCLRGEI